MSWIGAAASAIGGLFGLAGNAYQANQANKWNQKQLDAQIAENQKNRDFNHSEAEIARNFQADFAREMFDKTNKYNSMSNQVAQMRQAGINPALAYSGNSFAPGSMPSVSAGGASSSGNVSPTQYSTTDVASPALAVARQQAEIANIEASTKKIESDTTGQNYQNDILKSDAAVRDAWNQGQLVLQGIDIDLGNSKIDLTDSEAAKVRKELERLQLDIDSFDRTLKLLDTQIESGQLDNDLKRIDKIYKSKEYEALLDKLAADTRLSRAQAHSILSKLPYEIQELGSRAALNNALENLYDRQSYNVGLEGDLLQIKFSNASDTRSTRESLGQFGQGLWALRDFLGGLVSFSSSTAQ